MIASQSQFTQKSLIFPSCTSYHALAVASQRFASWSDPAKVALVRRGRAHSNGDKIALGNHILYSHFDVRKCLDGAGSDLPQALIRSPRDKGSHCPGPPRPSRATTSSLARATLTGQLASSPRSRRPRIERECVTPEFGQSQPSHFRQKATAAFDSSRV